MRDRYGASPLHLLAHLAVLPLVAWALLQVVDRPDALRILLWLALSAVVHDLVLGGRLPTLTELGPVASPIVYAVGGDAHRFLASEFGAWRIGLVYEALWKSA